MKAFFILLLISQMVFIRSAAQQVTEAQTQKAIITMPVTQDEQISEKEGMHLFEKMVRHHRDSVEQMINSDAAYYKTVSPEELAIMRKLTYSTFMTLPASVREMINKNRTSYSAYIHFNGNDQQQKDE